MIAQSKVYFNAMLMNRQLYSCASYNWTCENPTPISCAVKSMWEELPFLPRILFGSPIVLLLLRTINQWEYRLSEHIFRGPRKTFFCLNSCTQIGPIIMAHCRPNLQTYISFTATPWFVCLVYLLCSDIYTSLIHLITTALNS